MAMTACHYSSYFGNPFFTSIAYLINDKQRFMLFPSTSSFEVYMPTQDFHLQQNVLLMDVIMFSHKTASFILAYCPFILTETDSFILTYCPFKHQMNRTFLLVLLTLIFVILLIYVYSMNFQKPF